MPEPKTFYGILDAAVADLCEYGFDSERRVQEWSSRLREAAERSGSERDADELLRGSLYAVYRRLVTRYGSLKKHPGVQRWRVDRIAPRLRNELDRRIFAAAKLIKLSRNERIAQTLRRFEGWSTSIPAGGSTSQDRRKVKAQIYKPLASRSFEERRVAVDQGHKLAAAIDDAIAVENGAIAAVWFSHFRQPNYDFREDHAERDGNVYLMRDSWATKAGLVKVGPHGYADAITQPGEEVFCRCTFRYLYALRALPEEMLTAKGKAELEKARAAISRRSAA